MAPAQHCSSTSASRVSSRRCALPDAVLVPLSSFMSHIDDLPRDRQLLMICRSGVRSLNAGSVLVQHGFTSVANVEGGMIAWHQAGLPTHSGPPAPGEGEL